MLWKKHNSAPEYFPLAETSFWLVIDKNCIRRITLGFIYLREILWCWDFALLFAPLVNVNLYPSNTFRFKEEVCPLCEKMIPDEEGTTVSSFPDQSTLFAALIHWIALISEN